MSGPLARCKRRRAEENVRRHLDAAAEELHGIVLAADLDYAFWEPEWQDGPVGERHVQASCELRDKVQALREFALPDLEDLG